MRGHVVLPRREPCPLRLRLRLSRHLGGFCPMGPILALSLQQASIVRSSPRLRAPAEGPMFLGLHCVSQRREFPLRGHPAHSPRGTHLGQGSAPPASPSPEPVGPRPKKRKAFEDFDVTNVNPPPRSSCEERAWPAMKSRSGSWHCMGCKTPPQGAPTCAFCAAKSWSGMWQGKGSANKIVA